MSLAMISWAIAWTNAKIVSDYLSFYNLVFIRFILGFLSILPFILFKKIPLPKITDLRYLIIPSILFFSYNIAFFKGTHYGLAGKGAVLVTTLNPLITVIIMSLINKEILKKEIIGITLGIIGGVIIMNLYNEGIDKIFDSGNIYFLICALTWGIMTVSINYAQKIINPYMFICLCYLFVAISPVQLPVTSLIYFPVLALLTGLFLLGAVSIVSCLCLILRDLGHFTQLAVQMLFFLSPIIYPSDMVPEKFLAIYTLNPFVNMIELWRQLLYSGDVNLTLAIYPLIFSLCLLLIGGVCLKRIGSRAVQWL